MSVAAVAAMAATWAGACLLVLSDGRRGLAAGLAASGAGLALALALRGSPAAAGLVALGAGAAGLGRLRAGRPGWGLLPAGSTPRVSLCLVAGSAAVVVGGTLGRGGAAPAALILLGLSAGRLLGTGERAAAQTAAAGVVLGGAVLGAISSGQALEAASGLGALAALVLTMMPAPPPLAGRS